MRKKIWTPDAAEVQMPTAVVISVKSVHLQFARSDLQLFFSFLLHPIYLRAPIVLHVYAGSHCGRVESRLSLDGKIWSTCVETWMGGTGNSGIAQAGF